MEVEQLEALINTIPNIFLIYEKVKAKAKELSKKARELGKKRVLIIDEKEAAQIMRFRDANKIFEKSTRLDTEAVEESEENVKEENPDELETLKILTSDVKEQLDRLESRITELNRIGELNKEAKLNEINQIQALKQEKLEELKKIKELERLNEHHIKVKEFIKEYYPIYNKDTEKHYLAYKTDVSLDLITALKKSKKEKLPNELTLVSVDIAPQYEDFKEKPKEIEKSIFEVISLLQEHMKVKFISLLSLSIHIGTLYSSGKTHDAESIKQSIKRRYRYFGLKFCNLYQKGYLKNFFKSLKGVDPELVERKCADFLYRDTKAIFFLHKGMDLFAVDYIESELRNAFRSGQEYIAIHALGGAIRIAESIRDNLDQSIISKDYNIKQDKNTENGLDEASMIWYKGDKGKQILKLLHP